jgi:ribosomal protein L37AE/L43A
VFETDKSSTKDGAVGIFADMSTSSTMDSYSKISTQQTADNGQIPSCADKKVERLGYSSHAFKVHVGRVLNHVDASP